MVGYIFNTVLYSFLFPKHYNDIRKFKLNDILYREKNNIEKSNRVIVLLVFLICKLDYGLNY